MWKNFLCTHVSRALLHQTYQRFNISIQQIGLSRGGVPALTNAVRYCAQIAADDSADSSTQTVRNPKNPFSVSAPVQNDVLRESTTTETEEERSKRLKILQLEVDIAYQEGRRVPSLEFFKEQHWQHVLSLPSKTARYKYYSFLWQLEVRKESTERKKLERAKNVQKHKEELRKEREANDHIIYGLGHTALFLRIYDTTINHWQNCRLIRAMQFSPKIVLDCSYDNYMTQREAQNAAKQLMLSFAENRAHDDPFDLHYCNVNMNSVSMQSLKRYIPTMLNPEFPMNVHEKCFTELFPKENLVYLTPHCRTDLVAYNPDDIYIIGAMVDTVNNEPLSLAKAKRMGIRMARFPLDRYLQWGSGSGKSLTLNQVINIMLDLKKTKDWQKALTHVPRRKVVDIVAEDSREKRYLKKRADKFNIRLKEVLQTEDQPRNSVTVRSHMHNGEFNADTWASKKKNKNRN